MLSRPPTRTGVARTRTLSPLCPYLPTSHSLGAAALEHARVYEERAHDRGLHPIFAQRQHFQSDGLRESDGGKFAGTVIYKTKRDVSLKEPHPPPHPQAPLANAADQTRDYGLI